MGKHTIIETSKENTGNKDKAAETKTYIYFDPQKHVLF
jgi:hypothetical protein